MESLLRDNLIERVITTVIYSSGSLRKSTNRQKLLDFRAKITDNPVSAPNELF